MFTAEFIANVAKFKVTNKSVTINSICDHLNTLAFIVTLLITAGSIFSAAFFTPMTCHSSTTPSGLNFENTMLSHCWVNGTINLPGKGMPDTEEGWRHARTTHGIAYYQWIPYILLVMSVLLYLPTLLWHYFVENIPGLCLTSLLAVVHGSKDDIDDAEKRETKAALIVSLLHQFLTQHRVYSSGIYSRLRQFVHRHSGLFFLSKRMGSRIMSTYVLIKLVYIIVLSLQLFLMFAVFGLNAQTFSAVIGGRGSQLFPTRTVCHWPNVAGLAVPYIAVCVLNYNIVYQYLFGFLWLMFVNMIAVNVLSLLCRVWSELTFNQIAETKRHIELRNVCDDIDQVRLHQFHSTFLHNDGIFILRLIKKIGGKPLAGDVVFRLWRKFVEPPRIVVDL